jgi:hypothetical protein
MIGASSHIGSPLNRSLRGCFHDEVAGLGEQLDYDLAELSGHHYVL